MMKTKMKIRQGFTLIEMLVVIAIIALLAAILVPAVNNALNRATITRTLSNGRNIYVGVFAQVTEIGTVLYSQGGGAPYPLSTTNPSPSSTDLVFDNSTEYFKYLAKEGVLQVEWNFFAGGKVKPAPGRVGFDATTGAVDPATLTQFTGLNNAWNVVADLTDSDSGAPFLITRNVTQTALSTWSSGTETVQANTKVAPFSVEDVIVVRIGGAAETLTKKFLTWKNLNPGKLTNPILLPGN